MVYGIYGSSADLAFHIDIYVCINEYTQLSKERSHDKTKVPMQEVI